jgi:anti-sigma-K factor RskA
VEHRELQDLIPAHALNALDADDAVLLDGHIDSCDECRRELDDLRETTALLAFATEPVEPPARLRASILDAVAEKTPERAPRRARLAFLRGTLAGTLAGAAIALVVGLALHGQLNDVRSSRDAQSALVANLLRPGSDVRPLTGVGTLRGAVVRNGGSGRLVLTDLPAPAAGHTYEAWLIGSDHNPIPAGTFKGGKALVVRLDGDAAKAQTVAITIEPAGGSDKPTTTPISSASFA